MEEPLEKWKRLYFPETDEERFKSYFSKEYWTIPEFASLAAVLDPPIFDRQSLELSGHEYAK